MHPREYYRLPWTLNDNVLSWLEPTKKCNIYCDGCYSTNEANSHKSLAEIRADMDVFVRERRMDSMSIAGGEPLVHPDIVEIVRIIREEYNLKPVINTNGHAMTRELLHELKGAGLHGVTFHVDASQRRPGHTRKTNLELNEMRLGFAQMVAEAGGLSCAFNSTVFRDTMHEVPGMIRWAQEHIDIVHSMVFILFRTARSQEFDYFAGSDPVAMDSLVYWDQEKNPAPLTTPELFELIRKHEPGFEASAFLGGTKDPSSFKWTLVGRVGEPNQIYGYVGPRFMELVQTTHHTVAGRYLAYSDPRLLAHGRATLGLFAPLDGGMRDGLKSWLGAVGRSPRRALNRLHMQTFAFIQPIDHGADGEANMCDGCPDMTVHEGKLVWSCRLDELKRHGTMLRCVPKPAAAAAVSPA
ncbi:hypothetical protein LBMAG42_08690 [Deltaproteobacteria bacterium]|nr:hypothetical protein LBMAG42_08690 [Deltaproteobacteria bacterium]